MGKCLECDSSANDKWERCQDCHKGPLCYQHRFDHSILLDWGDTDSKEYKCQACENSYQARRRRIDEEKAAARAKQLKMEALWEEHERQEREKAEVQAAAKKAEADAKFAEWAEANPGWLEEERKSFLVADEARRNQEWEARQVALMDAKRKEFL